MTEKELKNIKKGSIVYIIFIIILSLIILLFTSCATMNTNIMLGVSSEYEDHVYFYKENQEYHHEYDVKLSFKENETSLSCNNFFYKKL